QEDKYDNRNIKDVIETRRVLAGIGCACNCVPAIAYCGPGIIVRAKQRLCQSRHHFSCWLGHSVLPAIVWRCQCSLCACAGWLGSAFVTVCKLYRDRNNYGAGTFEGVSGRCIRQTAMPVSLQGLHGNDRTTMLYTHHEPGWPLWREAPCNCRERADKCHVAFCVLK